MKKNIEGQNKKFKKNNKTNKKNNDYIENDIK